MDVYEDKPEDAHILSDAPRNHDAGPDRVRSGVVYELSPMHEEALVAFKSNIRKPKLAKRHCVSSPTVARDERMYEVLTDPLEMRC